MVGIKDVLKQYWGYDGFLPLQEEAMTCVLEGRDSVVVLPTGGGKSLCYQGPAMCLPGMAVVVSPLISLMKDQVDGLRECGVPAVAINSSLAPYERRQIANQIREGGIKLLYIAPERLVQDQTIDFLKETKLSFVAIDEAHCISEWGHDFRPEYRDLGKLRQWFPETGIHAYTATATGRVRLDIAEQLSLANPTRLVGSFDRKNLIYAVQHRSGLLDQIREVLDRHANESGIIYCTTRADTETTSQSLNELGYSTLPYHAGMSDVDRRRNQEAFIEDRVPTIVATIAFGMGIDKPNVRYVVHAGMPKSLENYQQESGRAGRDGLEAECVLIFSNSDLYRWKKMVSDCEPSVCEAQLESLKAIHEFCTIPVCRHKALVRYFDQELPGDNCKACDVCLGGLELVSDSLVISQKILSSVLRQDQRFGGEYTAQVLVGSEEKRIKQNGHDRLSTYGLLSDESQTTVRDWIDQLVGQGYLEKSGEYNVLQVTVSGRQLLKGDVKPRLLRPPERKNGSKRRSVVDESWEGVDRTLFDKLRAVRMALAQARHVPPYVIFGDVTLREMARRFPKTAKDLQKVRGVGEKKSAEFGHEFLRCISEYCESNLPAGGQQQPRLPTSALSPISSGAILAMPYFRAGRCVEDVAAMLGRAPSTVYGYLSEYLIHEVIVDWKPWVDDMTAKRVLDAARIHPGDKLKPIFDYLAGAVPYEQIRIVLNCYRNRGDGDKGFEGH